MVPTKSSKGAKSLALLGVILFLLGPTAISCRPIAGRPHGQPTTEPAQGIHGRVVKLVGDFLPTTEVPGEEVPLVAPVHVFRGRVRPFEKPDPKHPALVTIVQPDREGRFTLPLPPGEYTLVAEIDGRLYLNNWLDDGSWATVTVRPGRWSTYTIEDVSEATF